MINKKILYVEEEPLLREAYVGFLFKKGYDVIPVENVKKAFENYQKEKVDLVFTTIGQEEKGIQLIENIREVNQEVPILAWTGGFRSVLKKARDKGATATLEKPCDPQEVFDTLEEMVG